MTDKTIRKSISSKESPIPSLGTTSERTPSEEAATLRPREGERSHLDAAYSRIFFDYFKRIRFDGFLKHAKSVAYILDEIVSCSQSLTHTNKIAHCIVVFGNSSGDFAEVYAWSRELYKLPATRKEKIEELALQVLRTKQSLIHTSINMTLPVLVAIRNQKVLAYTQQREAFQRLETKTGKESLVAEGGEILFKIAKIIEKVIPRERGATSDSILIVPSSPRSQLGASASIRAALICFLSRDAETTDQVAWINSYIELEHISLALLSINELGSAFEVDRHKEKTRILEGTRQLTHLFVHSFGQCSRRITQARLQLEELPPPQSNSSLASRRKSILSELASVAADLQAIKEAVLSPLSELNWNRTGNVGDAIAQARNIFDGQLRKQGIDLLIENNFSGSTVVGIDTFILARLLENLFENSLRALEGCDVKKKIIIRVIENLDQNQVIVEVEDNGCGLPKDFNDWAYKTRGKSEWASGSSTGVGLFACRALLQMFGGDIDVRTSLMAQMSTCASIKLMID